MKKEIENKVDGFVIGFASGIVFLCLIKLLF